ncbi:DpnII family type II restriction endonuclease [Haloferax sp. S1W]|uniref:DpnII family type II restriction endonuclease n=1 Tax=Haloferax sp. S1W TaxID=3377110 RepID=UPI0037C72FDF
MTLREADKPTQEFVKEFIESLSPSSIPISGFVDWEGIDNHIGEHQRELHKIEQLSLQSEEVLREDVSKTLVQYHRTERLLTLLFELVSERNGPFVAVEGSWDFKRYAERIENGSQNAADEIAGVLCEIGLYDLLSSISDLDSYVRGVSVGFESDARKGRQGAKFSEAVKPVLSTLEREIQESGIDVELKKEYSIYYGENDNKHKRVDFAFIRDGEPDVVFELNSYTSTGSKPSEIVRGYIETGKLVRESGIEYIWVTDGSGWKDMKAGVKRAYEDFIDFYNYQMLSNEFPRLLGNYYGTDLSSVDITRTSTRKKDEGEGQSGISDFF